jgi:hypothetical protein
MKIKAKAKERHVKTQELPGRRTRWFIIALLLGLAAFSAACEPPETPTPCPEVACPECPTPVAEETSYRELWITSAHADAESESFTHWDEEIPAKVPTECAKCHSTLGYLDFLGLDGTEAGTIDDAAEIGTTIMCIVCHNEAAAAMDSVIFPSGVEITGPGAEARCMQCHQGRASTLSVDDALAEAGLTDDDTVGRDLNFVNIHYYAAAATQYGGTTMGGYQYAGKTYDIRFTHAAGYSTCSSCHDSHSLAIKVESCAECHVDVTSTEDLKNIRLEGSTVDYDGDGDATEGIYHEIQTLQEILYQAIQAYVGSTRTPIVYEPHVYPYFFVDTNANGETDADEAIYPNKYNAWTGRLLKAAYNYQVSIKDPGAFAHGGKYVIQLLYDSIEDLDADLAAGLHRDDAGHFAGSQESFRHWDEDGEVEAGCARCHSAAGLPTFLKDGTNISEPLSNGLLCSTCHDDLTTFSHYEVTAVEFPSGAVLDTGETDSNLCLNCHQGRQSTVSVDRMIAGLDADTVYEKLQFSRANVHYFAAGATLFGTEAQGAYEYARQAYNGRYIREEGCNNCVQCHDTHGLEPKREDCGTCHSGTAEPRDIRVHTTDFDGDGDTTEGIAGEIDTLHEALYAAIQDYGARVSGVPIVYDAHVYPYFFIDTDENGKVDPGEAVVPNQYNAWTPRLLQAAYNYQFIAKDPGAFAHNSTYAIQILHDSLADIGGDTTDIARPGEQRSVSDKVSLPKN